VRAPQFRRVSANLGGIDRGPAGLNPHVLPDAPARLLQPLQERPEAGLPYRIVRGCGQEHADPPHPLALLLRHAAIGHTAAAPPSAAKNFRRPMWLAI
jgi:hypothetical protein